MTPDHTETDPDRSPYCAVLFDMDGVIVDSEVYWNAAEDERILPAALTGEHPDREETTGMNYREIYAYLDANYDVTLSREEFIELYNEIATEIYTERVSLMDGFRELCATLRESGYPIAVVSSAPTEWISLVADRFDLDFDRVLSAEDAPGPGKPEPDVYEHAASLFECAPEACLVVEDSANGTQAAASAGATVIGYRGAANADLGLPAATVVVSGPAELRAELRRRTDR
jgi:HAD superfamily hydrolase (TIGR01509 family)